MACKLPFRNVSRVDVKRLLDKKLPIFVQRLPSTQRRKNMVSNYPPRTFPQPGHHYNGHPDEQPQRNESHSCISRHVSTALLGQPRL